MPPSKHRTAHHIHTAPSPAPASSETPAPAPGPGNSAAAAASPNASSSAGPPAHAAVIVSRDQLLASLRRSIEGAAPEMIDAIIAEGKDGSYLHTKFLFEFAGLSAAPAADVSAEQSLAATLLRALALNSSKVESASPPSAAAGPQARSAAKPAPPADALPSPPPASADFSRPNGACKRTAAARP